MAASDTERGGSGRVSDIAAGEAFVPMRIWVHPGPGTDSGRWGSQSANKGVTEYTTYVNSISFTDTIYTPYGGCRFSMKMPTAHVGDWQNPAVGDWVSIRENRRDAIMRGMVVSGAPDDEFEAAEADTQDALGKGTYLFFGVITSINTSMSANQNTGARVATISIEAENWFNTLSRMNVWVSPGLRLSKKGQFWRDTKGRVWFSPQVEREWTGNAPWETEGNKKDGYKQKKIWTYHGEKISIQTGTMFDLTEWMNTFVPRVVNSIFENTLDPNSEDGPGLMFKKIFEYLALNQTGMGLPGVGKGTRLGRWAKLEITSKSKGRVGDKVIGFNWRGLTSIQPAHGSTAMDLIMGSCMADSGLMEVFPYIPRGSTRPHLIYRMRPWRTMSLTAYAKEVDATQLVAAAVFDKNTWGDLKKPEISASDVLSLSFNRSMEGSINTVTVRSPNMADAIFMYNLRFGLPIFNQNTVRMMGAITYVVDWPFVDIRKPDRGRPLAKDEHGAEDTLKHAVPTHDVDWFVYMRTIAVQGFMFQAYNHRFMTGSVRVALNFKVEHGQGVRFEVPMGRGPVLAMRSKGPGSSETEYQYVTAYVESVTHSCSVGEDGSVKAYTDIQFTRGLPESLESKRTSFGEELYW